MISRVPGVPPIRRQTAETLILRLFSKARPETRKIAKFGRKVGKEGR